MDPESRAADGVFTWMLAQKQAGKCRFVGLSGHNLPGRFLPFLESGDVDVILVAVNYVDRYTYNNEKQELAQLGQTLAPEWGPHFGPVT